MAGSLQIGQTIGEYRVEQVLGNGHSGVVYLVSHLSRTETNPYGQDVNVLYALKELVQVHPTHVQRFSREANIIKMMNQVPGSNLVKYEEEIDENGTKFLVMEFVKGQSLEKLSEKPISESLLIEIAIQICHGLEVMHTHHPPIIHKDIKPENIRVRVKNNGNNQEVSLTILDLGIAILLDGKQTPERGGTLRFAHPQQIKNGIATHLVDQHDLGATLFYLMMAEIAKTEDEQLLPFPFENWNTVDEQQKVIGSYHRQFQDVIVAVHGGTLPRIWNAHTQASQQLARTSYSLELKQLVLKMIAYEDSHKFSSIAEVKIKLEKLKKGKTPTVAPQRNSTLTIPRRTANPTMNPPTSYLLKTQVSVAPQPVSQMASLSGLNSLIQVKPQSSKPVKRAIKPKNILTGVAGFVFLASLFMAIAPNLWIQARSKLLATDDWSIYQQWSPDSQYLLFISRAGELTILNVFDGHRKVVLNLKTAFPNEDWSYYSDTMRGPTAQVYWLLDQQHVAFQLPPKQLSIKVYEVGLNGDDLTMLASTTTGFDELDKALKVIPFFVNMNSAWQWTWLDFGVYGGYNSPDGKWAVYFHDQDKPGTLRLYER